MDHYEPNLRPLSSFIDIDGWGDSEEIELGSEEHDLFLQEDYVKPANKDVLPFRANSPAVQANGFNDRITRSRSQNYISTLIEEGSNQTGIDSVLTDRSRSSSPTSASVIYRTPNFQQFAGNLAPSSPASVVVSFIIIVVILFVTIVPIIIPQQATISNDLVDNVIESNNSPAQSKIVHADARCKCICPPPPQTNNDEQQVNPTQRRLYVGNTSPDQCNCNNIVQPHLTNLKILLKDFCIRCECRYQSRNTTTIRRNVIFFIVVLLGLGLYMFAQYLLKYFRINRRNLPYRFRWLSHQLTEGE